MSRKIRTVSRKLSGHGLDYGVGVTAATVAPMLRTPQLLR